MINLKDIKMGNVIFNHNYEMIVPMTIIKIENGFIAYLAYMAGSCSKIDCVYLGENTRKLDSQFKAWHISIKSAYAEKSKELSRKALSFKKASTEKE